MLMIVTEHAGAATVYIDPTCATPGTGANPTCTGDAADAKATWASVTWVAGNTYLQKEGTIAKESVIVGATGTAGNVITIGSYGTGKAIIQPTTQLTSWTQVGTTNIWYASLAASPLSVFIYDVYVQPAHWPTTAGSVKPTFKYPSGGSADATHLVDSALQGLDAANLIGAKVNIYINAYTQRNVTISAWDDATNTLTIETTKTIPTTAMRYYLTAPAGTGIPFSSKSWMMTENTWFYDTDAKRLYVWKTGGGNPEVVEASSGDFSIYALDRNYITVDGIKSRYARNAIKWTTSYAGLLFKATTTMTDITIKNVDVFYSGYAGITVYAGTSAVNVIVENCTVDKTMVGILFRRVIGTIASNTLTNSGGTYPLLPGYASAIDNARTAGEVVISGNTITTVASHGILNQTDYSIVSGNIISDTCCFLSDCGAIYTDAYTGGIISSNTINNTRYGIYLDISATNYTVEDNKVIGGRAGLLSHEAINIKAQRNKFTGPFSLAAIYINDTESHRHSFEYNLIDAGGSNGIYCSRAAANSGIVIVNNTIMNANIGLNIPAISGAFADIYNNIFYNNKTHVKAHIGSFRGIDYNLYYGTGDWYWDYSSKANFALWKAASSQDANSINSDPLFTSRSVFTLGSESPAINAGIYVTGVHDVPGVKDCAGNSVYKYDIGAYTYTTNNPEPLDPPQNLQFHLLP